MRVLKIRLSCAARLGVKPRRPRAYNKPSALPAAMEKALAELLASSGLKVMNRVVSRKPLDEARFAQVRAACAKVFPQLAAATPVIAEPGMASGR